MVCATRGSMGERVEQAEEEPVETEQLDSVGGGPKARAATPRASKLGPCPRRRCRREN